MARAMAVRCSSPPESCVGSLASLAGEADEREHPFDRRADDRARACRSPRARTRRSRRRSCAAAGGSPGRRCRCVRRRSGTSFFAICRRSKPATSTRPWRRLLVPDEQLDERGLAGSGGPDEEDEVALRDDEVDVDEGGLPVRVGLADALDANRVMRLGGRRAIGPQQARDPAAVARATSGCPGGAAGGRDGGGSGAGRHAGAWPGGRGSLAGPDAEPPLGGPRCVAAAGRRPLWMRRRSSAGRVAQGRSSCPAAGTPRRMRRRPRRGGAHSTRGRRSRAGPCRPRGRSAARPPPPRRAAARRCPRASARVSSMTSAAPSATST